jgi:two-component system C4-dicarboxylate transport response regulator DctD
MEQHEAALIRDALEAARGDVRAVLEILQLPRKTFYDKLHRHEIRIQGYRRK